MNTSAVLIDAFSRIQEVVHETVEGLQDDVLSTRPNDAGNSIAWLVWHLTRIQDDHLADAGGYEQAITADGWHERLGLPFDPSDTGYGHTPEDVAAVKLSASQLTGYYDAVHARSVQYLETLTDDELERVVDKRWNPPVTLGVRLNSVLSDDLQHAGQAAYVRGLLGG
ncbi:mycothiol transferase [Kribbella italica]|uniref:Putative damage-inducible protein DinB n=1 Tax=Kribbella italica TaxID=1540520 RepID=A0A7W9J1Z6_9ACTN|nr:DinB family protein [Kribbella italica]MBB5833859.1 putative damage-inducible protein DinB [Kribbella italica]